MTTPKPKSSASSSSASLLSFPIQRYLRIKPGKQIPSKFHPDFVYQSISCEVFRNIGSAKNNSKRIYAFDKIIGPDGTNNECYNVIMRPLIENCNFGHASTLLVYGQTGTGKTHTLMDPNGNNGLVHKTCNDLIQSFGEIKCAALEIYCATRACTKVQCNDLLQTGKSKKMVDLDSLYYRTVASTEDIDTYINVNYFCDSDSINV